MKIYFHIIAGAVKKLSYTDMHKNKKYICRHGNYFVKCAWTRGSERLRRIRMDLCLSK